MAPAFRTTLATITALLVMAGCASRALAQAQLPPDFHVALPQISDRSLSLADYGANADGKTLCTSAIAKAISAATAAGGGTVIVPAGRYLTGPFALASNINLHLDAGATLVLSDNPADYKVRNNRFENCITAADSHDVAITGSGVIDGNGRFFWEKFAASHGDEEAFPHRPYLIAVRGITRLLVQGVTLTNSPMFHLVPSGCRDVTIDGITIKAPARAPNTDGIDPSGMNYLIEHCTIDTGDDNIALKPGPLLSGATAACDNFLVTDCTFLHGHGMSIGGQTNGGDENLLVRNCTFDGTDAGIRMKSTRGRGGVAEHLSYENLTMKNVKNSILITSYYPRIPANPQEDPAQAVQQTTPAWKHIRISHVSSTGGANAGEIVGLPEMPVEDVVLDDVQIAAAKPMTIANAKGIRLVNSSITGGGQPPVVIGAEVDGLHAVPSTQK